MTILKGYILLFRLLFTIKNNAKHSAHSIGHKPRKRKACMRRVYKEKSEEKMLELLKSVLDQEVKGGRYLVITPPKNHIDFVQSSGFTQILTECIEDEDAKYYFFDSGEVVVIVSAISKCELQNLSERLIPYMGLLFKEQFMKLYELPREIYTLIQRCEEKIKLRRQKQEAEALRLIEEERQEKEKLYHKMMTHHINLSLFKNQKAQKEDGPPKVLIVDDDSFSALLVDKNLRRDHTVLTVNSGAEAIQTYFSQAPDIVFLDINLPDLSGHEVLQFILSIDPTAFIVMLSGNSDQDNILHAVKDGAKGFVAKPFTRKKLLEYIRKCTDSDDSRGVTHDS